MAAAGLTQLVSSDLLRARQTASAVSATTGLDVEVEAAFREVDLGAWEGLTEADVARKFPDELAAWQAGIDVRRGGGETLAAAGARFVAGLEIMLAAADPDASVLVVAHGLVLRRVLAELASAGRIDLPGDAPHLGNGQSLDLLVQVQV